jgi:ankyrin repeat protein
MKDIIKLINNNNWDLAINSMSDIFIPIVNGNNILQIACIRGRQDIIKQILLLKSKQIYNINDDGDTCCHLLAKQLLFDLLLEICIKYPEFLKIPNNNSQLIIHLTLDNPTICYKILLLMIKYKYIDKLNIINNNSRTFLLDLIDKINNDKLTSYLKIINKLYKTSINFNIPQDLPPLIYAIMNKKYNLAIKLLNRAKLDINIKTSEFLSPLILAILHKHDTLVSLIIKKGGDINYGGQNNNYLPIIFAINNGLWNICYLLLNSKTKIKLDLNKTDKYLNTPLHYACSTSLRLKMPQKLFELILLSSNLLIKNIKGTTALHLLIKYKLWKQYEKLLLTKDIDINIIDKYNNTPLTYINRYNNTDNNTDINKEKEKEKDIYNKDLIYFTSFIEHRRKHNRPQILKKEKEITLPPILDIGYGVFNSDMIHNLIYTIYILKTFPNITIPFQTYNEDKVLFDNSIIDKQILCITSPIEDLFSNIISIYTDNLSPIIPHVIFWRNKNLNYIYDDTILYIKRAIQKNNKRFIFIKLVLFPQENLLHANIILYDIKTNILRRFEPYGDWEFMDSYILDKSIIELFKQCLSKQKIKTLKYLRPGDYLHNTNFQLISNDTDSDNKKLGDPAGYCLAWCFWYIELKLSNPDMLDNELVEHGLKKIIDNSEQNDPNPVLSYIRNYAIHLDVEKNKILYEIGFTKRELYELSYSDDKINKIINYVNKFLPTLLL